VVKNAAGYDLCRLLIGSLGTLAVVTEVTLMVKPIPEASGWAVSELSDLDAAEQLLAAMVDSETRPSAVELLAGPAWGDDPALGAPATPEAVCLAVGFEGARADVDWMLDAIRREREQADVAPKAEVRGHAAEKLWDRFRDFPAADPEAADSAPVVAALRVPPSGVVGTVGDLRRADPGSSVQAHAGHGVVQARFSLPPEEIAELLARRLRPSLAALGGSAVITSYPAGSGLDRDSIWGPAVQDSGVMRAIKSQLDPVGVLNPGRFIY